MSRSYLLKPYVVLYRDDTLEPADPPFGFDCQAEDGDHAEEQCLNAYPEADVVWIAEGVATLDEAYEDYYNYKGDMKFRVHVFEEIRHTFTISAKDIDEAATLIESGICTNWQRWESSEPTGYFSDEALIDPLNEDGAVDCENATWFTQTKSGEYVRRGSE